MKVIVVDDEPLALRHMASILRAESDVDVIGAYVNPLEAISAAQQEKPDLVFLDIELPMMNGLETAEHIMRIDPAIQIVFITAYSHYAIVAFEINALDYLLKPVKSDRVRWALQRVRQSLSDRAGQGNPVKTSILLRTLGPVVIEFPRQGTQQITWRTKKAQELFVFLLFHEGKLVRKDAIIDRLWPDLEGDKPYTNLYTTVYQLRRTLERLQSGIRIISGEEGYFLELGGVRIDADEWEAGVLAAQEISQDTLTEHLRLLELNQGSYLQGLDYSWAVSRRGHLDTLWVRHVSKVIRLLMDMADYTRAIQWCQELQRRHPDDEFSAQLLKRLTGSQHEPSLNG